MIGTGKTDEIIAECKRLEADCLIFDDDLSPSQQRNWEKLSEICVIDRREVILDIFASRAQTSEARLQVQLARLEYSKPRLRRAWTHLERQQGGAGIRGGAGELQLEIDQRLVANEILTIRRQMKEVRRRRAVQRKERLSNRIPTVGIVGYTNAGKSTLLNALSGAEVLCEDKLFATLDPVTRRVTLPDNRAILLTDTVGFIRKLPHALIDAFKATLEETCMADYLIHVADVSHPNVSQQIAATNAVLAEIGADGKPTILALNKIDCLDDRAKIPAFGALADHVAPISAQTGEGIEQLLQTLAQICATDAETLILEISPDRYDAVSLVHREGRVIQEEHLDDGTIRMKVELPERLRSKVEGFIR
ncbi:MAG: GTPase HflX [Candidatus Sumerlaeota bacterium]|nr:GTPase HflX [Candidatus Sumerlaeota bacterium]